MTIANDFYEDDEPLDDVIAAFENGVRGETAPPSVGHLVVPSGNTAQVAAGTFSGQAGRLVTEAQAMANNNTPVG